MPQGKLEGNLRIEDCGSQDDMGEVFTVQRYESRRRKEKIPPPLDSTINLTLM
jgi:hypothetical protein